VYYSTSGKNNSSDYKRVDLEISSNKQNDYMVDIKSGGTNYNFNPHIEYEFN
jgi:hypothetical protein